MFEISETAKMQMGKIKSFSDRQAETIAEYAAHKRVEEIRRLARNHLMHSRDLSGTREEALKSAVNKATLVYDDVEAVEIKPKKVPV